MKSINGATPPTTRSELLRAWRVNVKRAQAKDVAPQVKLKPGGVSAGALSQWESGQRQPSRSVLSALDAVYDAGHCLEDLSSAMNSPNGLPAQDRWLHNFAKPSGPCWAWVRPATPGLVEIDVTAGPVSGSLRRRLDEFGLVITAQSSWTNPAAVVDVRPAGWVDFGRGAFPAELGLPVVAATDLLSISQPHDPSLQVVRLLLQSILGHHPLGVAKLSRFAGRYGPLVDQLFEEGAPGPADSLPLLQASSSHIEERTWSGSEYRRLREARGYSRPDVAQRLTAMLPTSCVSDDQLAVLENGGQPHCDYLCARLDRLYRADGLTCSESVPSVHRGTTVWSVTFPRFWVGPIWIRFIAHGAEPSAVAVLRWGPWMRRVLVQAGARITTRRATESARPLTIKVPAGWAVEAGLGRQACAHDVGEGWSLVDGQAAKILYDEYSAVGLQAIGATAQVFDRFLRSIGGAVPRRRRKDIDD